MEMYGLVLFEGAMADVFSTIHPKEMLMSRNTPTADNRIRLTTPQQMSLGAWLSEEEEYLESVGFDYSVIPIAKLE